MLLFCQIPLLVLNLWKYEYNFETSKAHNDSFQFKFTEKCYKNAILSTHLSFSDLESGKGFEIWKINLSVLSRFWYPEVLGIGWYLAFSPSSKVNDQLFGPLAHKWYLKIPFIWILIQQFWINPEIILITDPFFKMHRS